jgi:prefoldin subunit 5
LFTRADFLPSTARRLADLETRVTKIDDSLSKVNGSISRLEQMMAEIEGILKQNAEEVTATMEVAQAMSEALDSMIPRAS